MQRVPELLYCSSVTCRYDILIINAVRICINACDGGGSQSRSPYIFSKIKHFPEIALDGTRNSSAIPQRRFC